MTFVNKAYNAVKKRGSVPTYQSVILADSPVAYWQGAEASGISAADSTGRGNTGTYSPNALGAWTGGVLGSTGIPGAAATAPLFNGSTGYITVPNSTDVNQTGEMSVECWVNFTALPADGNFDGIVCHGGYNTIGGSGSGWELLRVQNSATLYWVFQQTIVQSTTSMALNTYYYVACLCDGANIKIYVNGSLQASAAKSSTPSYSGNLYIGQRDPTSIPAGFITGNLAQVALYNYPLTLTQITAHYNAGIA